MNSIKISTTTVVIIISVGVLLVAGGFLISTAMPYIFPAEASAESKQVDQLFRVLLIIGGAIFLLVQGLLVFSVLRFRVKPGDATDGLHIHGNTLLEIVWTAVPAVIVIGLALLSWQIWNDLQTAKPGEVAIHVDGRRFNWAFTYDAPLSILNESLDVSKLPANVQQDISDDNALTITVPELHTYVGQSVLLKMKPQDVIHALWIPAFRIKQDLIPGRETSIRFTAVEVNDGLDYPKVYPVRCAELCGANHGLMVSSVIVHANEADYDTWLAGKMDGVIHPPADPVIAGQQILTSGVYPCPTCHIQTNLGWAPASPLGPSLNGVGDRAAGARGTATGLSAADYIYQSVHDPSAYIVPGFQPLMPQLNVPDCQVQAIVAYLCTQTDSGTPACSEPNYAQQCAGGAAAEATSEATSEATQAVGESTVEATSATAQSADATVTPVSDTEATSAP